MIPASQLTFSSAGAASNGYSIQFRPFHTLNVTKGSSCSLPSLLSGKLDSTTARFGAQQAPLFAAYASGLQFRPLHRVELRSQRGRERGVTGVRRSLSSSPFLSNYGSSSVRARANGAAAPEDFSLQAQQQQLARRQKWNVCSSISDVQEQLSVTDDGDSSSDDDDEDSGEDDRKVETKTTVLKSQESGTEAGAGAGQEDGLDSVVEEYKLGEDGTLSTVRVSMGGATLTTTANVKRVLAEVGVQAGSLQNKILNFSVRRFIKDWGKKEPGLEDLKFNAAMYEPKEGVSNITQWTATELTLQRAQMIRIARDTQYLIWAFSLFGFVRVLEAVATVFSTSPPNYMKIFDALNALDPFTIASLASAMRKPVVGMLDVDPTDLEEVSSLKAKFWAELHKFYERQWKVMATLGFARLLTLIVMRLPSAEWVTSKLKIAWDISMALPIF